MKIVINGREHSPDGHTISHEDVCRMVGKPASATVTYSGPRRGDSQRRGELRPGQVVELEPGLIFNAMVTSGA